MTLAALPVFTFRPDWSATLRERLAWTTNPLTARNGAQSTRMLSPQAPRRSFEFDLAVQDSERQLLDSQAYAYGRSEWWLPIWTDGLSLQATHALGVTTISVDPSDRDFSVGGAVVLLGATARDYELVEIATVGASDFTLATGTLAEWPAGTLVLPARKARTGERMALSAFTDAYGYGRLLWQITEPCTWTADDGAASYRSFPVLTVRPVTTRDLDTGFDSGAETFDAGLGPVEVFDWAGIPLPRQAHDWGLNGRTEISTFRSLLYALQGRAKSIWVPTWLSDLTMVASLGSGSTALQVAWRGYTDHLVDQPNRQDIRIELRSGTVYYRRITASSEVSASVEELTLSSSLGVAITVDDVLQISFMALCRCETDAFDFDWWTGDFADVSTAWRGRIHDL